MSLPSDVTVDNLKDFYAMILPYLNVGNGGTSDTPLGQVAFFDDVVAPAGWLIADGTVYNIADYPDLATQYERVHGSKNFYGGNGTTTFAVPDWQGEFLRASGTNSHANQGSGANVGVHQDGTEIPNSHSSDAMYSSLSAPNNQDSILLGTAQLAYVTKSNTSDSSSQWRDYTSRPTNTSLLLCIKAVPSSEMNTYSTTERRVGTWIDGKPLYQNTWINVAVGTTLLTNCDTLTGGNVVNWSENGTDAVLATGNMSAGNSIYFQKATNTISVTNFAGGYTYGAIDIITLQYTKTTDV